MPQRIDTSLLVVAPFTDARGFEYREGDRAPLDRRSVRQAALQHPEWFVTEYSTEPVDLAWLRKLDAKHDIEFEQLKAAKGTREARRQRALREELKEQGRGDPKDLERRFEKQEKERAEREKKLREAREQLEAEFAQEEALLSGFHFDH
jgi:hypothetical protein